ncbi:excinuclease ABC subunit C [Sedimentisphaera cyanobacteriorum]|uniref:Excinuclease ABC subunit C n=1 Tax=Sedimentisphaera cyanobacteriorum TaxID=1940790 RepID=A0A1Q2HQH5_9BACT|nr:DNA-processing protein DprA [Sedimentisphaera cyanobacteriorum]AQQ09495.1 excinuclease ABC subunit C [Sedimentisphaera cyanobacteriorum]
MDEEKTRLWLKLSKADGVGPAGVVRLLERFGCIESIAGAGKEGLKAVKGIGDKTADSMRKAFDNLDTSKELELCENSGIGILTFDSPCYPELLKSTKYAPAVLYYLGDIEKLQRLEPSIAIVGSRRCSFYGKEQARILACGLGEAGFSVVSGMARGIDSESHYGALTAGGDTIAVLGCGLMHIYPPENKGLFKEIAARGVCLSQFAPDTEPRMEHFVPRNKIIAGLSEQVLVVEAGPNSGAIKTASFAREISRQVFAVPGRIDSRLSFGSNKLIKEGAVLCRGISDILNEPMEKHKPATKKAKLKGKPKTLFDKGSSEELIAETLNSGEKSSDEIIEETGLNAGEVNSALTWLQIKGAIERLPGNKYKLARR